jgi:hypothetical protein
MDGGCGQIFHSKEVASKYRKTKEIAPEKDYEDVRKPELIQKSPWLKPALSPPDSAA